ncbi:hypothetical protein BCV70DRAFT_170614, partial [Testicularia cyperi]
MSAATDVNRSGETSVRSDKTQPTETHSITFEWPLYNLRQYFDSSKTDTKSKVIKSLPFGGGKWTVLFYAQSGVQQFCSLYLNAEPQPDERSHPLLASPPSLSSLETSQTQSKSSKDSSQSEERWFREGLFRFTFKILSLDKAQVLGTKEAHDHAFSHKTSNWGWAQFAPRDSVFYSNSAVRTANGFLISVSITASAEKPRPARSQGIQVPPVLVQAMGSLLDDPDHSDIVFTIGRKRCDRRTGRTVTRERKIYAIKKILATRCEYFRDMFDGGFLEADAVESSDDEDIASRVVRSKVSSGVGQDHQSADEGLYTSDEEIALDDSDEELFDSDRDDELEAEDFEAPVRSDPISVDGLLADHAYAEGYHGDPAAGSDPDETNNVSGNSRGLATPGHPGVRVAEIEQRHGHHEDTILEDEDAEYQRNEEVVTLRPGQSRTRVRSNSAFETPSHSPRIFLHGDTVGDAGMRNGLAASARSARPPQRSAARSSHGKKRRKVVVRDAAYPTFKSLLYYLYTDTVDFAPLTSSFLSSGVGSEEVYAGSGAEGGSTTLVADDSMSSRTAGSSSDAFTEERRRAHTMRRSMIEAYCQANPNRPNPCSAKSMYKLADKLQIPDLKRRAQEHLASSLTVHNIVWEVFSGFNTRFPDIRKMETDFLLKHWPEVKRSKAMKTIFTRPMAHPGLADVWPYLLSQLEYNG